MADACQLLKESFSIIIPKHPLVKYATCRKIVQYINTPFFDLLRSDYAGFNNWFKSKCEAEDRPCYYLDIDNELSALMIFNKEQASEHSIPNIHDDALKICTLKVASTAYGLKIGELFLSKLFRYCIENKIPYLYVTAYPKQTHLITLLEQFGFRKTSFTNKQGQEEIRMLKSLLKSDFSNVKNETIFHPFYSDRQEYSKYIVPIDPKYYNSLFKDGGLRTQTLFDDVFFSEEIQGNTILKAYLCYSKTKGLKKGDILFFYSSKNAKVVEPIGILEDIFYSDDLAEIKNLVAKRTVYTGEKIEEMLRKGKLTVILFRLAKYLDKPVNAEILFSLECSKAKFVTITKLSVNDYKTIKDKGYFDERYIVN